MRNFEGMIDYNFRKEYSQSINAVISYILKNLREELPLKRLASVANYSIFHFQKLFTQLTGESPRQFVIRMRLEHSARRLIIDRHKSVTEIAMESGFANAANFARAFKNYFGISAVALRNLSPEELLSFRKSVNFRKSSELKTFFSRKYNARDWAKHLDVSVVRKDFIRALSLNATLTDTNKIQEGYKKLIQLADFNDLLTSDTKFIGIMNPLTGLYQPSVTLKSDPESAQDFTKSEIHSGKYATYKIKGDSIQTIHSFHAFYERWLTKSNYRIKDHFNFEILSKNPLTKPYYSITREIYIPIEPK